MPKVTERHRENRREEILNAAITCFASKGFHATSMGDIIRASGLSTGAIYSYFKSKRDIAVAVAQRAIGEYAIETLMELSHRQEQPVGPADAVKVLARGLEHKGIPASLIIQLWGEALNDDSFHDLAVHMAEAVFEALTSLLERWAVDTGRISADMARDWAKATVPAVVALLHGYVTQSALLHGFNSEAYLKSIRILIEGEQIYDDDLS